MEKKLSQCPLCGFHHIGKTKSCAEYLKIMTDEANALKAENLEKFKAKMKENIKNRLTI